MPANRRRNRKKNSRGDSVHQFFFVQYSGSVSDTNSLQRVIDNALTEAFGEVGGARFECFVCRLETIETGIRAVLHAPHEDQRRDIWAALTMLGNFGGESVRFSVTATCDSVKGMEKNDSGGN